MKKNTVTIVMLSMIALLSSCGNDDVEIIKVPASNGAVIDANVGGEKQPNQVYIDLSTDTQTSVDRSAWDLGFSTGSEFAVVLNESSEVMVRNTNRTAFSEIIESDTTDFGQRLSFGFIFSQLFSPPPYPSWLSESITWLDDPTGDLSKTAIGNISANAAENNVYYVARGKKATGESRGAYFVKVTQDAGKYKVTYKNAAGGEEKTIEVNKDPEYNFAFFNFDTGIVTAAPKKTLWDISFTVYLATTDAGGGLFIPYNFMDFVVHNRHEVQVAQVDVDVTSSNVLADFNAFTLADVGNLTYSNAINTIGTSWRSLPRTGLAGVKEDKFYVVKDGEGNQYKLLFTGLLNASGERGFPQITYELLK